MGGEETGEVALLGEGREKVLVSLFLIEGAGLPSVGGPDSGDECVCVCVCFKVKLHSNY